MAIINGLDVKSLREYVIKSRERLGRDFTEADIDPYLARAAVEWAKRLDPAKLNGGFLGDMRRRAETCGPTDFTDGQIRGMLNWWMSDVRREKQARERATAWSDPIAFDTDGPVEGLKAQLVVKYPSGFSLQWPAGTTPPRLGAGLYDIVILNTKLPDPEIVEPVVPNGYYTVVLEDGTHVTVRLRDDKYEIKGRTPPRGQQVAAFLSGPDNTSNYTRFATVRGSQYRLWSSYKAHSRIEKALRFLLGGDWKGAGDMYYMESKRCYRCNKELTRPGSITRGLGDDCAGKVGY